MLSQLGTNQQNFDINQLIGALGLPPQQQVQAPQQAPAQPEPVQVQQQVPTQPEPVQVQQQVPTQPVDQNVQNQDISQMLSQLGTNQQNFDINQLIGALGLPPQQQVQAQQQAPAQPQPVQPTPMPSVPTPVDIQQNQRMEYIERTIRTLETGLHTEISANNQTTERISERIKVIDQDISKIDQTLESLNSSVKLLLQVNSAKLSNASTISQEDAVIQNILKRMQAPNAYQDPLIQQLMTGMQTLNQNMQQDPTANNNGVSL